TRRLIPSGPVISWVPACPSAFAEFFPAWSSLAAEGCVPGRGDAAFSNFGFANSADFSGVTTISLLRSCPSTCSAPASASAQDCPAGLQVQVESKFLSNFRALGKSEYGVSPSSETAVEMSWLGERV